MTATYPGTLPEFVVASGYNEQPQMPKASFTADVGPPIERPKGTFKMREIASSAIMIDAELAIFEAFVWDDLAQGSLPFMGNHPRLGTTVKLKLKGDQPYSIARYGVDWQVSATLLVLGA
jgi:hypothetical protein